ncbi:Nuclear Hormone Receptor family [Caenorhabditis elegans]|uniref:Nuclear Hormone Receptor family n=1 Tax=Caenorhabditis elegans TaxID=6239 RepID=O16609_CAEEL|nr:Nuclear Hormone Receptor family [Caenorhabditis elegans]CCD64798.1 Nuclear Hormone Receptor family [Caenorhabditis elegans]|eukprot:NP_494682.1 Nuclear Hormone Receptor family [Caenorhabditis elegans]
MSEPPKKPFACAICRNKSSGCHYGVLSCDACKMFFKRTYLMEKYYTCRRQESCYNMDGGNRKCKACRFKKCLEVGMNPELFSRSESQIISTNIPTQLITQDHRNAEFLQKLKILDKTRHEVFKIIDTYENPSFVDLVRQESRLSCYLRPKNISWENTERKLKPWGSLGMLLAVETIKSLDFYPKLLLSDRILLLETVTLKSFHLSVAFDSFSQKKEKILAPDGSEMFPDSLNKMDFCKDLIMRLLTTPVKPLIAMKLTETEYLLLGIIVICNPEIDGLSPSGKAIITAFLQKTINVLLQFCLINNPRSAPSRLLEIISINQILNRQFHASYKLFDALRKQWDPTMSFQKVLVESCKTRGYDLS